ncbi:MAG: FAD:protein FMN transferase [Planctomycetota bacterium]|jgi:thiamine biosynthesis lipoprotein|nr:FAD:protein FMN transferase [Planctomycetota bacterium]
MSDPLHKIHRVAFGALALALVLIVAKVVEPEDREVRPDATAEGGDGLVFKSRRFLMGTEFKMTIWAPKEKSEVAAQALGDVFDELAELEQRISSWQPDSETSRVNRNAGNEAVPVGTELQQLLSRSLHWAGETDGAFDVSGGPLFELWEQARERGVLPSQEEIDACRALTGHERIDLRNGKVRLQKAGMKLGFGAIGKGFAADQAAIYLQSKGLSNYIIDAGGDLLVKGWRGDRPWSLAVRHPRGDEFLARLESDDCAVTTSGDYERFTVINGQRYSHILNLRSGRPATDLTSVTVIARSATDADALATALFVMDAPRGLAFVESLPEVEAILMDAKGETILSKGLRLQGDRLTLEW